MGTSMGKALLWQMQISNPQLRVLDAQWLDEREIRVGSSQRLPHTTATEARTTGFAGGGVGYAGGVILDTLKGS